MTLRVPLAKSRFMTIICAYAPALTSLETVKDSVYQLHYILFSDQLLAATNCFWWATSMEVSVQTTVDDVIGKYGVGTANSTGLRLLNTCSSPVAYFNREISTRQHGRISDHNIGICSTTLNCSIFRPPRRILPTRSMHGAECWTDHRLIRSKVRLQLQPLNRKQQPKPSRHASIFVS